MGIIDAFRKNTYATKSRCENCSAVQETKVPVGRTIDEFLSSEEAMCKNCGCPALRRIIVVGKKAFYPASTFEQVKQKVKEIDQAISPQPIPRKRNPNPHYEIEEARIDRPLRRDESPTDFGRPKKVNFWTGDEQ